MTLPSIFYAHLKQWSARGFVDIGFTGTLHGMTPSQCDALATILHQIEREVPIRRFHHGDCLGADAQAHAIALGRYTIVVHPPSNTNFRAYCLDAQEYLPAWPYDLRNKDIVNASDLLIAAPQTADERQRSGTWSTVRYARGLSKNLLVLAP